MRDGGNSYLNGPPYRGTADHLLLPDRQVCDSTPSRMIPMRHAPSNVSSTPQPILHIRPYESIVKIKRRNPVNLTSHPNLDISQIIESGIKAPFIYTLANPKSSGQFVNGNLR